MDLPPAPLIPEADRLETQFDLAEMALLLRETGIPFCLPMEREEGRGSQSGSKYGGAPEVFRASFKCSTPSQHLQWDGFSR